MYAFDPIEHAIQLLSIDLTHLHDILVQSIKLPHLDQRIHSQSEKMIMLFIVCNRHYFLLVTQLKFGLIVEWR